MSDSAPRRKLVLDAATRHAQATASNPRASAWVSANAGSGKTFVLARRVIRLLLDGVDPARILCLTFTKAAAAEMSARVFAELGRWTTLDDAALSDEIADIEGEAPSRAQLAAARRLFARALDTPGGLKIQTIHAFCERLLHQFPFEANVAGHFEVLDERTEAALMVEARRHVLAEAAEHPDGDIGRALEAVLDVVSDMLMEQSLQHFVARRDQLQTWIAREGSLESAIRSLGHELGVSQPVEALRQEIVTGMPLGEGEVARLVARLDGGTTTDQGAAARLRPFLTAADVEGQADAWLAFLCKDDGEFRSLSRLITKTVKKDWPGLEEMLGDEMARLEALKDRIAAAELFAATVAMLTLAAGVINAYGTLKQRRGLLDFEDLVIRTAALLSRSDAARWVQYKLDRGLDHILVDEAQDTSPRQWQVVRALVEEFFAGEGAAPRSNRTIFAVGDEKQSIYSFQGAVPAWFSRVRRELGARARAGNFGWHDLELHLSFRSVPHVLGAVDHTFAAAPANVGLSVEPRPTVHTALRRADVGRVVIWPRIEKPEKPSTEDWDTPVDHLGQASPEMQLARRIAQTIAGWLASGATLDAPDAEGRPRPIRAGGILVLLRSRGALAEAVNRALKEEGVPLAGADRLRIMEHIAVMDLAALGRVMLLPEDDLSLAAVLKSPLIGLDEEALFVLAHDRGRQSLWNALGRRAGDDPRFQMAHDRLHRWRADADWRDPHGFYARVLGPDGGRAAFLRRLGVEAEDVLDEFLAQALAFEQTGIPSMQGFLNWLETGETEIKRDTDTRRDEVRVMTVHGAKGLEADVVFLIDNGTMPTSAAHDQRMLPLREDVEPDDPGPVIWMHSPKKMPKAVAERLASGRARNAEEYRRLLYVGMTRARDQLYVVGLARRSAEVDERWHALVENALAPELVDERDGEGNLLARHWRPAGGVIPGMGADKGGQSAPPVRTPAPAGEPASGVGAELAAGPSAGAVSAPLASPDASDQPSRSSLFDPLPDHAGQGAGPVPAAAAAGIGSERVSVREDAQEARSADSSPVSGAPAQPNDGAIDTGGKVIPTPASGMQSATGDSPVSPAGAAPAEASVPPGVRTTVPAWAREPAPPAPRPPVRLTPSTVAAAATDENAWKSAARSAFLARHDDAIRTAMERGRIVHRLLQSLPDLPPEHRAPRARDFLAAFASEWPESARLALADEVLAVLSDERFAAAFAPGSRAEVEIAGHVSLPDGREAAVSGRIDRLSVTPDRVLIVDYKTNRPAPATLAETPPAYVAQLALYRLLLQRLYPDREVAAALLWTDLPVLMDVPASALDEAAARLSA